MALHRALSPTLVLCAPCRDRSDLSDRLVALADPETGALLVRAVCAAADCAELALRGHLCADHILDFELAWQHLIPVRVCHGCRQSVLVLCREQRDVWFILPRTESPSRPVRSGVDVRYIDKARLQRALDTAQAAFQSPVRAAKGKARLKLSSGKKRTRRSARTLQQICDKERLRALEWSLGNIDTKHKYLWQDNKRRLDAETKPLDSVPKDIVAPIEQRPRAPSVYDLDEPLAVYCATPKCRFFAKSGDRCRFHSSAPLRRDPPCATAPASLSVAK